MNRYTEISIADNLVRENKRIKRILESPHLPLFEQEPFQECFDCINRAIKILFSLDYE